MQVQGLVFIVNLTRLWPAIISGYIYGVVSIGLTEERGPTLDGGASILWSGALEGIKCEKEEI